MNLFAGAALGISFFAVPLLSGGRVFGAALGAPMRGAVIPLLGIPLLTDWLRFAAHFSPARALAVSTILYLVVAALFFLRFRPQSPFSIMDPAARRYWMLALVLLFASHALLRVWLFTGTVPNPADDGYSGYKANALIHTPSWPTMFTEALETPMAYYYYAYEWPAALASWAGVPLRAGWWVTAIILCASGSMLIFESILPRFRDRRDFLLGTLVVLNGCSISFVLAAAFKLGPRFWTQEAGILGSRYHLYLRTPQFNSGYWSPFAVFVAGLLGVVVCYLWRLIEERKVHRAEFVFVLLTVASLAGYCTFDLIGFAIVFVPVLTVAAIIVQRGESLRRWLLPLAAMGIAALAVSLPIVLQLSHRAPGSRQERFKDPLLVWLHTGLPIYGLHVLLGLLLWFLLALALSNLLVLPILFPGNTSPRERFTVLLLWIFGFGTFVCLFGVIDDFVPKFGIALAAIGILAFYSIRNPPVWSMPLLMIGLIGPGLGFLDTIRANVVLQKADPIWKTLDALNTQTHEVVLYDVPLPERYRRTGWTNTTPYFSQIEFVVPVNEIDDLGINFMVNPAQLATLPPTAVRMRQFSKGAPTYLLLRTGSAAPAGVRLYSDGAFTLDRVKF